MGYVLFNKGKYSVINHDIDFRNDTIKCALVGEAITNPDLDYRNQITEVTGTGYTAGGVALTNKTVIEDDTNNVAYWDCDNVLFTALNVGTVAGIVIYKSTGNAATDILIGYADAPAITSGNNVEFTINASGLLTF